MNTETGPATLRFWADALQHGAKISATEYQQAFRELAAAWETERNELTASCENYIDANERADRATADVEYAKEKLKLPRPAFTFREWIDCCADDLAAQDELNRHIDSAETNLKIAAHDLAETRQLLFTIFPQCVGYKADGSFCRAPAEWTAEWSDRSADVCDEHKHQVQSWYDGDHEYDKTGLRWAQIAYADKVIKIFTKSA